MQIALKYLEKIRKLYSQPSQKQRCKLSVADTESMLSKLIMFHYPDSDDRPIIKIWKPVVIVGDLNGQVMDLLKIMELEGQGTPSKHYLFLGNYIQGAQYGLQTILIIFCLKLKYPDYIHILRGSTQTKSIAQSIGFQEDCCLYPGEEKGSQIPKNAKSMAYGMFLTIFARLPIIGVIQNKIFCVHGGLTPHSENVQDYFEMAGQEKEPRQSEVTDLLWSKFSEDIQGYRYNEKKRIGHLFGPDQVFSFLKTNDYDLMINSGEFLPNGYRITCEEKLITIYSASNFLKYYKNTGCYLKVSQDLQVSFVILKPKFPAEDEDPIIKVRNTEESREFKKEKKHG